MQHGIITLLIVNIFISILLYINNKRLKSEIEDLKGWCKSKLNQIIDEETNIDKKLAETIKQISDNKVAKDVIEIMDYEGKCPYHNTVFKDLIEYQSDMINKVQDIRNQKEKIISTIIEDKPQG